MIRQHPARVAALLLTMAALLAACGSGSTASSEATSSTSESTSATTEVSASASASESGGSGSSIDLGNAAQEVSDLSAYQLDVTVGAAGEDQVMSIIATTEPVKATHYTIAGQLELISIEGEGTWLKQGDTWTLAPGGEEAYANIFDSMAPDTLIGGYALDSYGDYFSDEGTEERNGVQARHLHADASTVPAVAAGGFPEDGTIDVWVAVDGGYLVAMHFRGTDTDSGELSEVRIEVSRVNDNSISIVAPI